MRPSANWRLNLNGRFRLTRRRLSLRASIGLCQALQLADLRATKVGQHAGRLAENDIDHPLRNLIRVDRLQLPRQRDRKDGGQARETTKEHLNELVKLR